jgi:hypothetical protein
MRRAVKFYNGGSQNVIECRTVGAMRCVHAINLSDGGWCCGFEIYLVVRCTLRKYRTMPAYPYSSPKIPPQCLYAAMFLLTHAQKGPIPRQLSSLRWSWLLFWPCWLLCRLKTGRSLGLPVACLVPRLCFQLPRSRLFSCFDNHLHCIRRGRRIISPGSFVILLLLSP